ncbi:MAG TPA: menaquinol oxidoreductase [Syntrophaceae bacterium]|jgi:molybdopterin-containing oxidoreductase family membrane subunit|nr:menaquinol oxidoreductase [Syntrophaceae bacterium]HCX02474.1 menaquinol oxidoreductase [Syntrophaceae bacterium]
MLEKALKGGRGYWVWIAFLLIVAATGFFFYLRQLDYGLGITGMSRDVSWGLYIAQFTFLVGVAASAVMLVLPYYLHDYKAFGKITVLGEFLAVAAVIMCVLFIFVDLGQPSRVMNVLLHPQPTSILFWDMIVLTGYLLINIVTGWVILASNRKEIPPPGWVKPLIYLSIPWAVSIHTVTAFIYAGLPGRSFWLTAIMAPRFLASAFASGPALLIIFCLILRRYGRFDAGEKAIQALAKIVAYALAVSIFFILVELFTAFYSQIPEHMRHFQYLFAGLDGYHKLVSWMWASAALAFVALAMLIIPPVRRKEGWLAIACVFVFVSLWIEKGLGLVIPGFIPSPLEAVTEYMPTGTEIGITLGVWTLGLLLITLFYKIFVSVRNEG